LIGISPIKGITLGPRSGAAIDKAMKLGPDNPRIWFQKGLASFYTPKMFGGGKDKALEELTHAIELYQKEAPPSPIYPQWGYDEAYAWVGQIYQEQGRFEEAKKAYEAGLQINPASGLIRYNLLPNLEKATEGK
jgi:tetratricopeptide (TPR) repeat protein